MTAPPDLRAPFPGLRSGQFLDSRLKVSGVVGVSEVERVSRHVDVRVHGRVTSRATVVDGRSAHGQGWQARQRSFVPILRGSWIPVH